MTSTTRSRFAAAVLAAAVSFLSLRSAVAQRNVAPDAATATVEAAVIPPLPLTRVDAEAPPGSPPAGDAVDVVLAVTVGVDGQVSHVETIASGGAAFDSAATRAAWQWTFTPAQRNGQPIASRIRVPFHFAPPSADAGAPFVDAGAPAAPVPPSDAGAPPEESPDGGAPPADAVETVTIVGGRLEARSHGTSDYQVDVGELKAVPRANASDALKLAPGFLLTNEGGSGHAEQVFLRGFDAHEGQDLEFSVDGVPVNDAGNFHGNGYADTHFILPELIQSVRVLEGPYAPQQGDFAVAGSADFHLGLERRGLTTEYTIGSFGTQRFLTMWGPSDAPTGTFGAAEYYTTDGFGSNRQAKRGTGLAQYEIKVGGRGLLRLSAVAYATEYNSAGVVRQDDYQSGRVGFYGTEDPAQAGNTATRAHLAVTYENHFKEVDVSQQVFVIDRSMRLRENFTGFLQDVQLTTQSPHAQRGDLNDFEFSEQTLGARGFARWHGEVLKMKQEIEGGYFARVDHTTSTQYRDMAANGDPYLTEADLTSTLADVGVYVDGNVRLAPWLALRGGVRADMFLFDVLNNCAVNAQQGVDSPSKQYLEVDQPCLSELEHGVYREPVARSSTGDGVVMPRATLIAGPLAHLQLTGSIGDGVRSVDPSYVAQGLLTPFVKIQSQDVGLSYENDVRGTSVVARSVFFRTHSDQDLLFDPTAGRSTLSTGSTRLGWAGSARERGSFFDVAANATLVRATFDDTGLLVPYVPDLVLRADAALFHDLPWRLLHEPVRGTLGYGVSYVGPRPLPFSETSDVIFVSDASLSLGWDIWTVRFSGQNLFDARYKLGEYNYASDFHSQARPTLAPERSFTAGAPQQLFLSLAATFGGSK